MPAVATHYEQLLQYLNHPPARVIDDWAEFVCPHEMPLPPEWCAPTTFDDARERLRLLSRFARVIAAMTAAELALPVWDAALPASSLLWVARAPREAIAAVRAWLDDEPDAEQRLATTGGNTRRAAQRVDDTAAMAAASAAECAADHAAWNSPKAASAARCFVLAMAGTLTEAEAYDLWWRRSICRLAFDPVHRHPRTD